MISREKEAKTRRKLPGSCFEKEIAKSNVGASDVVQLLRPKPIFDLLKLPYPSTQKGVIDKFLSENLIVQNKSGFDITKLGAILFAKNLSDFGLFRENQYV